MKLKFGTKIAYGLAGVGDSALYSLMGTFALFFLTTIVGMSPAIAGTIAAIGSVWETVCGAVIGYISDNTITRFGRRKPFLFAAAFPLAIFTSLFFTTIDADGTVRVLYYVAMIVLFWTSFASFFVPYLAWGAELTQDYNERTVLRGYVYLFNTLGMAIGMILPTIIVDFLMQFGKDPQQSWQAMGIFCGLCSALTIFLGAFAIKDKFERGYKENLKTGLNKSRKKCVKGIKTILSATVDMFKNYKQILTLRAIKFILGASVFYLMAYAVFCADRMYFFKYNMGMSSWQITFIMAIMTFASVIFLPPILCLNKRFDKRELFIAGMGICTVVMIAFGFIGISSLVGICIFTLAYCAGSICYWQLIPAMIYDVCEVDQLINGKERAGLVISLQSLSESLANAVGLQMLGLILQFAGFDGAGKLQSTTSMFWIHTSFTIIPALFMILSIIMVVKYPVTKVMYNKVLDALSKRGKGEDVDMKEFTCLK